MSGFFDMVEISAQYDVIRGEPRLAYLFPNRSFVVGGANGVYVDSG